ncbi:hypothetical protein RGQ29_031989 [Quercus rubra]|uniref:Nascent polypeptide-associated complex subunit alpha-like UBA domain-containing protein n=1 Tax=Quercus rubra TaxID=3512 RepID=A0AAN7I528_QUERU|nr:hypothetical protein RGQ29_031989 [Quercus rubra]
MSVLRYLHGQDVPADDAAQPGLGSEVETNGTGDSRFGAKATKRQVKHDSGAADLEKVTDYMEDSEISSQNIEQAVNLIGTKRSKDHAEKVARQKELDKVTISKEDVELIMNEMEIPKSQAEQTLREHAGDVVQAFISLTD